MFRNRIRGGRQGKYKCRLREVRTIPVPGGCRRVEHALLSTDQRIAVRANPSHPCVQICTVRKLPTILTRQEHASRQYRQNKYCSAPRRGHRKGSIWHTRQRAKDRYTLPRRVGRHHMHLFHVFCVASTRDAIAVSERSGGRERCRQ